MKTFKIPYQDTQKFSKLVIDYLSEDEELEVATKTTSNLHAEPEQAFNASDMEDFARLVRMVPISDAVARYAVRLSQATRPNGANAPEFVKQWVSWGAGTRATRLLIRESVTVSMVVRDTILLEVALRDLQKQTLCFESAPIFCAHHRIHPLTTGAHLAIQLNTIRDAGVVPGNPTVRGLRDYNFLASRILLVDPLPLFQRSWRVVGITIHENIIQKINHPRAIPWPVVPDLDLFDVRHAENTNLDD